MIPEWLFAAVLFLNLLQLFLVVLYSWRKRNTSLPRHPGISALSVVVPFCNEEKRIRGLIETLNQQTGWSANLELLFVNDGSTDRTVELLHSELRRSFRLINCERCGKKAALDNGIRQASHPFILTLDADVKPGKQYFQSIFELPGADMTILPVNMRGDTLTGRLATIEFNWLQLLTFGSARPVLCNGANLLFRKSAYLETFPKRADFGIASGDDVFLLQAMLDSGKIIHRAPPDELAVETKAPSGLAALLRQRKRWIRKFGRMRSPSNIASGSLVVVLQVAFFVALAGSFFFPWFMIPLVIKLMAELMAATHDRGNYLLYFGLLIFHQFWYPFYLLLLLLPVGSDPRWAPLRSQPIEHISRA